MADAYSVYKKPLKIPFYYRYKIIGIFYLAWKKFNEIDGVQRAAAFSYYTLFSMVPLIVFVLIVTSFFVSKKDTINSFLDFANDAAITMKAKEGMNNIMAAVDNGITVDNIIDYVNVNYIPLGPKIQELLKSAIKNVIKDRQGAGAISFLLIFWGASLFFNVLVHAINRAWNKSDLGWLKIPFKNLVMVLILIAILFFGLLAPAILHTLQKLFPRSVLSLSLTLNLAVLLVPQFSMFFGFLFLYKFAPHRKTKFSEVWFAALVVTVLLHLTKTLFIYITVNISNYSVLYGTLGSLMALLMWIYLSGLIVIYCACICPAQFEVLE
ncbi:MAG: YihY/virulence factor BrkB family protein [Endomicrobiales bacterium]|nr:YihY/virulence factor BrkB family protein [Endomicrobiales bacterium]